MDTKNEKQKSKKPYCQKIFENECFKQEIAELKTDVNILIKAVYVFCFCFLLLFLDMFLDGIKRFWCF